MTRIAILSTLFNWPSTGGGTVHSAEVGKFLAQAGYDVLHVYARHAGWQVGNVQSDDGVPRQAIDFSDSEWNVDTIQQKFRSLLQTYRPDGVIVTDSWNFKPLLAEAARGFKTYLRLAAQECLCPLNNVRLLVDQAGHPFACPKHQLATAEACRSCVQTNEQMSGWLHQQERNLSGYGTAEYDSRLRRAFAEAEAVLVVNPAIAANVAPYARSVKVIPSGFDAERFPWPWPETTKSPGPLRLFFAGLTQEYMKGFHVLQAAARKLWEKRQDFEIVATADAPESGAREPFVRYIGWQSQEALPKKIRESDILVFPTIAEEALGRSAVEAMGVGRPVIASRIGGLPYTVTDEVTGLLFEPGNVDDLVRRIERLLDDKELRKSLGRSGRKKFEREFTWDVIIEKHYKPLFGEPRSGGDSPQSDRCLQVRPKRDLLERNGIAYSLPGPVVMRPSNGPDLVSAREAGEAARVASAGPAPTNGRKFQPRWGEIDHFKLLLEMHEHFGLPPLELERMQATYRSLHRQQKYAERFGEWKTLSFEEAFLLCVQLSLTQPAVVVHIGAGEGQALRRIVDLRTFLGQSFPIVCHDLVDSLIHVQPHEVERRPGDLCGRFRSEVLERQSGGLIYLDEHRPALIEEVVQETLAFPGQWTLAIHDCGGGLCNPHPTADRSAAVSSAMGVWQRHVLAQAFKVKDVLSSELDLCQSATHRLRVFSTQHGLALISPQRGAP